MVLDIWNTCRMGCILYDMHGTYNLPIPRDNAPTQDNWLYEYWQIKILQNKIISIPFLQQNFAKIAYDFVKKTNHAYPKCYHTDRDTQQELAKCIYQEIQTQLKIS